MSRLRLQSAARWQPQIRAWVALVLVGGLIAASGTDLPERDVPSTTVTNAEPDASGSDTTLPLAEAPSGSVDAGVVETGPGAVVTVPPRAGGQRAAPAPGEPASGTADGPGEVGPGITDTHVTVGIGWFDINAYARALAPTAEGDFGTTKDAAEAIVRWINDHGGVAGRQIEPIYHEYPLHDVVGSNSTRSTREQAMCSDFTEDHRAFAAIPWISSQGVFYECAAQHNLVTIATSFSEGMVDETLYEELKHVWYVPHSFLIDRRETMFVEQLDRRGFFAEGAKIGLVLQENPATRRGAERTLEPALRARGVDVVERAYYSELYSNWENMVLRFQAAGVTHVIWGSSSCSFLCAGQFMTASENQRYRPLNALGSDHGISGIALVTPRAQLERIVAIGWSPLDVGSGAYETAAPINENDVLCRQIKKESGVDVAQSFFAPYCDGLFFIKQTLERASNLTAEGFRETVEGSGYEFHAVDTWSTSFPGGRHDGSSAVRDLAYDPECDCFVVAGPTHAVG